MAIELVPAVLAVNRRQFTSRLARARHLSPHIHLDLMDGHFVPTRSVDLARQAVPSTRCSVEIHAMVDSVGALVGPVLRWHPRRVFVHVELGDRLWPLIAFLRSQRIAVGLAINPTTRPAACQPFVAKVDALMVMGVKPGRYQAPYQPLILRKIAAIHRRWPKLKISCDGGMNPLTVAGVVRAGAKRLIIGSDVILNPRPQMEWRLLQRLTPGRK